MVPRTGNGEKELKGFINLKLVHELFLNQGLFLLFGGILIGFVSRLQGKNVTDADDPLFNQLFQGLLCLFLLEMGITACRRLKDLKTAGWPFIAFAIIAPNIFATFGMCVAHGYSLVVGEPFQLGTYVLFAVLCGAASYIAVPAIQRLAIPEASPTLPLAASLGCTFSYNVTIGIPVYIEIAKLLTKFFPHAEEHAATASSLLIDAFTSLADDRLSPIRFAHHTASSHKGLRTMTQWAQIRRVVIIVDTAIESPILEHIVKAGARGYNCVYCFGGPARNAGRSVHRSLAGADRSPGPGSRGRKHHGLTFTNRNSPAIR